MEKNKKGGFEYYLTNEQIEDYNNWPVEMRLKWLSEFNALRKYYPKEIIESHEKFRSGELMR
ncbi:MAG: hypothetical protein AB1422_05210 [bacterium]